ncbi:MAG TPA: hypothetical protein VF327_13115 [Gaiellaceae bacterium]
MRRRLLTGFVALLLLAAAATGAGGAGAAAGPVRVQAFTFHNRLLARDFHELLLLPAGSSRARQLYLDVGRTDDLQYPDTSFVDAVRAHGTKITFRLVPGGHSGWDKRMPMHLRWYASACR